MTKPGKGFVERWLKWSAGVAFAAAIPVAIALALVEALGVDTRGSWMTWVMAALWIAIPTIAAIGQARLIRDFLAPRGAWEWPVATTFGQAMGIAAMVATGGWLDSPVFLVIPLATPVAQLIILWGSYLNRYAWLIGCGLANTLVYGLVLLHPGAGGPTAILPLMMAGMTATTSIVPAFVLYDGWDKTATITGSRAVT